MGGGKEQGSGNIRCWGCTCPHTRIRNCTPVDGHGEPMPKIISFMKACGGYTRKFFLDSGMSIYFKRYMSSNLLDASGLSLITMRDIN